jgi:hypothetical protein
MHPPFASVGFSAGTGSLVLGLAYSAAWLVGTAERLKVDA